VFDRDTGKPKGYGFCEYRDPETALSAMRNLNGFDMNGRPLRVDFAENEKGAQDKQAAAQWGRAIPPIPSYLPGQSIQPGDVMKVLEGMSQAQLYEVMVQMKLLVQQNTDHARQILLGNPALAYALLQAQVILGMINSSTVKQLQRPQPQMGAAQPPPQPMPQQGLPMGANLLPQQIPGLGNPPQMGAAPPNPPIGMSGPGSLAFFPQQPIGPQPGMTQPFPMNQTNILPDVQLQEQQKLLLQQVMSLTPQQIEVLPPQQREQVQQLRQTMLNIQQQQQVGPPPNF